MKQTKNANKQALEKELYNVVLMLDEIINCINVSISFKGIAYEYTARSLFKGDRLMFALHVVRGMQPDMFLEGEWDFLIGLLVEAGTEEGGGRAPSWLEAERGGDTSRLLATFPSLGATLQMDEGGIWGSFMKTETPEKDLPVQVGI